MAFLRRTSLPDDVRARVPLHESDRILVVAQTPDGWAVATLHGFSVLRADGEDLAHPWSDVDGARLDPEAAEILVTWVDGTTPTTVRLLEWDRNFARTVYDRVQWSVVHRETVTLPSGRQVRVAARRVRDDALVTQVIGAGDVDLTDPATAEVVDAAETRVRDAVGLT